jgi:hypothetical protein
MIARRIALLLFLGAIAAPAVRAQIQQVEMRVEGMT